MYFVFQHQITAGPPGPNVPNNIPRENRARAGELEDDLSSPVTSERLNVAGVKSIW